MAAKPKEELSNQTFFFGPANWAAPQHPLYEEPELLRKYGDDTQRLAIAMSKLTNTHELGLSMDSGHGWLSGSDMSDRATFTLKDSKERKVFGKHLPKGDERAEELMNSMFIGAQKRTLDDVIRLIEHFPDYFQPWDLEFYRGLSCVAPRSLSDFISTQRQFDHAERGHCGGHRVPDAQQLVDNGYGDSWDTFNADSPGQLPTQLQPPPALVTAYLGPATLGPAFTTTGAVFGRERPPTDHGHHLASMARNLRISHPRQWYEARRGHYVREYLSVLEQRGIKFQWPIIYNGYDLSALIGGWCTPIQKRVSNPVQYPFRPGSLTKPQAQWLSENLMAQRAFLNSWITSIMNQKELFSKIHSLHIGKISSGLLPEISTHELWKALPNLKTLTILVSPDWRKPWAEVEGHPDWETSSKISPLLACQQLGSFLQTYIAPLVNIYDLTIGYVGGGEHATGLLARNRNVLPAPVCTAPLAWLGAVGQETKDDSQILFFPHVAKMTVQNAWFSPEMLERFVEKACESSLNRLCLDSISLSAMHATTPGGPSVVRLNRNSPPLPATDFFEHFDSLENKRGWSQTIDNITPNRSVKDYKYERGLIDTIMDPRQPRNRGHLKELVFKSCGYVLLSGIPDASFNQNRVLRLEHSAMDSGLRPRFEVLSQPGLMLDKSTHGDPPLGTLTQCVTFLEKSFIQRHWGMIFGWKDDISRWGAVEDGCYEGGTGRFSGRITARGKYPKEDTATLMWAEQRLEYAFV